MSRSDVWKCETNPAGPVCWFRYVWDVNKKITRTLPLKRKNPFKVSHLKATLPSESTSSPRYPSLYLLVYKSTNDSKPLLDSGPAKSQIKRQRALLWGFYLLEHTGRCWKSVQRQGRKSTIYCQLTWEGVKLQNIVFVGYLFIDFLINKGRNILINEFKAAQSTSSGSSMWRL